MENKSFEYKKSLSNKKITVRTKGILLKESKSVTVHHLQENGANYNVYSVTQNWLNKNIDQYMEFLYDFLWDDNGHLK